MTGSRCAPTMDHTFQDAPKLRGGFFSSLRPQKNIQKIFRSFTFGGTIIRLSAPTG